METKEGNILIAEFDGFQFVNDDPDTFSEGYYIINTEEGRFINLPVDFQYHSSWDWLVPVVKKIRNLKIEDGILVDDSVMTFVKKSGAIIRCFIKMDLEKAWETTVEFIKWWYDKRRMVSN